MCACVCVCVCVCERETCNPCSFCEAYGGYLGTQGSHRFHTFPSIKLLVGVITEGALRDMGFGYRAR